MFARFSLLLCFMVCTCRMCYIWSFSQLLSCPNVIRSLPICPAAKIWQQRWTPKSPIWEMWKPRQLLANGSPVLDHFAFGKSACFDIGIFFSSSCTKRPPTFGCTFPGTSSTGTSYPNGPYHQVPKSDTWQLASGAED